MEAWQIVLLILILVMFAYVAVLMYVGSHSLRFHRSLKHRVIALNILCLEKRDALAGIDAICKKRKVVYSSSDKEAVEKIESMIFDKPDFVLCRANLGDLKSAQSHLAYLAQKNPSVRITPNYDKCIATLEDVDRNIRQVSSLYNSDVVAYNYWLSVPLCRWIPFIMGCRKRDPIN